MNDRVNADSHRVNAPDIRLSPMCRLFCGCCTCDGHRGTVAFVINRDVSLLLISYGEPYRHCGRYFFPLISHIRTTKHSMYFNFVFRVRINFFRSFCSSLHSTCCWCCSFISLKLNNGMHMQSGRETRRCMWTKVAIWLTLSML